jgi:hypothetical protein
MSHLDIPSYSVARLPATYDQIRSGGGIKVAVWWKRLIIVALLLNVFEGAVRKWVIPSSGEYIYFLKDFVLLCAYSAFFLSRPQPQISQFLRPLRGWLLVAALAVSAGVLNPSLGSVIAGAFGAKCYLLDVPLLFLVPHMFASESAFKRFVRWYVIIAIPVCLLGVAQFDAPADSTLNRYAAEEAGVAVFGVEGSARVTGTFSYISGHTAFLLVMAVLALGVLGTERLLWARVVAISVLVLVSANLLMSGSRAPLLISMTLIAASFVAFGLRSSALASRLRGLLLIVAALAGLAIVTKFSSAYDAFMTRVVGSEDEEFEERAFQNYDIMPALASYVGPFGLGTGITHPGSYALRTALELPQPSVPIPAAEAECARVLIELGMLGLLAWYGFRIAVIVALCKVYRTLRSPELRFWAFLIFMLHFLSFNSSVVLNHTYCLYFWFLAGVGFGLLKFDKNEQSALQMAAASNGGANWLTNT